MLIDRLSIPSRWERYLTQGKESEGKEEKVWG